MTVPRSKPRRWRSEAVPLKVLGSTGALVALGLGGCSQGTYHRNIYNNAADCVADYSATQCSLRADGTGRAHLGPVYRMVNGVPSACRSSDPGGGRAATLREKVETVQRSGFGATCRTRSRSWWSSAS